MREGNGSMLIYNLAPIDPGKHFRDVHGDKQSQLC